MDLGGGLIEKFAVRSAPPDSGLCALKEFAFRSESSAENPGHYVQHLSEIDPVVYFIFNMLHVSGDTATS